MDDTQRKQAARRAAIARKVYRRPLPDDVDTLIDFARWANVVRTEAESYRTREPFPHLVVDGLLREDGLRAVLDDFPRLTEVEHHWIRLDANMDDGSAAQRKKHNLANVLVMKPAMRQLVLELNSASMLQLLEELTGIENLLADPMLQGGGAHVVEPGGVLRVHADFNRHSVYGLVRRVNLLLYLNEDWSPEYGGALELWDRDVSECREKIPPTANRCVVFDTSSHSFHGHPEPLACPPGLQRRSVAMYYYTVPTTNDESRVGHSTLWRRTPDGD